MANKLTTCVVGSKARTFFLPYPPHPKKNINELLESSHKAGKAAVALSPTS